MTHNDPLRQSLAVPKPVPALREPKTLKQKLRPIPPDVKRQVFARDDYLCQFCRVIGGALDCHHRLRRSAGGRDIPAHCVSVHRLCHDRIHREPAEAYERGFLVHSEDELARGWI